MSDELNVVVDTPVTGETTDPKSTEDVSETTPITGKVDNQEEPKGIDPAEFERIQKEAEEARALAEQERKEREKREMHINQLQKKLGEAQGSDDKDLIIQELQDQIASYEAELRKDAETAEAQRVEKEIGDIFEKYLAGQQDEVKRLANIAKKKVGIWGIVGEANSYFQAEENIKSFLDELASEVKPEDEGAPIPSGNVAPKYDVPFSEMTAEQMRDYLPKKGETI